MSLPNVERVYPLSALQRLMLVNIVGSEGAGQHVDQVHFQLTGELDPAALRAAFATVVQRHPALRTAFFWEGLSAPVQVVRSDVALPWREENLADLAEGDRTRRIDALLVEEQSTAFDLGRAPLMRIILLRTGERTWAFVWTYLVVVLDGWSVATVLREVFSLHEAAAAGGEAMLPAARPFHEFIAWLQGRDPAAVAAYWRGCLADFNLPTPIPVAAQILPAAVHEASAWAEVVVASEDLAAIRGFCQRARVTLNTLVQGAWGLLLGRYACTQDVVFGVGSSGRPAEIEGVDAIVGQFTNNVPLRLRLEPDSELTAWLQALQRDQSLARDHEHAPLDQIEQCSAIARGSRLFETLLQFHNFPLAGVFWENDRGFTVTGVRKIIRTNYPLTLVAIPQAELSLSLRLVYDDALLSAEAATAIVDDLVGLVRAMGTRPDARLCELGGDLRCPPGTVVTRRQRPAGSRGPATGGEARTATEERIAAIWSDVLGVEGIGIDDNLFELGARSVHVVRMHARMLDAGYSGVSVVELFRFPRVRALARRLDTAPDAADAGAALAGEQRGRMRGDAATRARRERLRQARFKSE